MAVICPKCRLSNLSLLIVFILVGCAKHQETSGIVSVEGAELHYVIEGKGTPGIVLGHSESER